MQHKTSTHFRNKKKEYLKAKTDELENNSNIKNIRDLYRSIRDLKDVLFTDSHSTMARWRNHFSQLLNIHRVNDVRQTEIQTSEPLLPEPSAFDFEMATEKPPPSKKNHKSQGTYKIPTELIKAGDRTSDAEIHKLITSIWNKEKCLRSGRSQSLYLTIRRVIKQVVVIIKAYHFCQVHSKFYPTSCCQG
jgi:hypothetical protein